MEISVFNANSIDPDQTPHFVASDLGLHCLPVVLLGVSRLKLVKLKMHYRSPFYQIKQFKHSTLKQFSPTLIV